MREIMMTKKRLVVLAAVVLALSSMGMIFLAPVVIYKATKNKGYEATVQMSATAEKVFSAAVSGAEEKAPKIKIVKKEEENMFLEVTDGVQTATLKVKKASDEEKSDVTITASVPKKEGQGKEAKTAKEKELALRVAELLCTKLDVECTVTKE